MIPVSVYQAPTAESTFTTYLTSQRAIVTRQIEKRQEDLDKNYLYFFKWYADEMYTSKLEERELDALEKVYNERGLDGIKRYLENSVDICTDRLLENSLANHSTSELDRIVFQLELEFAQTIRNRYIDLLDALKKFEK